ncbi:MAG TPA: HAMP domain-containing sensor histidine kinase, partial [Acidimicrobiales bacterium]|nr:HAMP domain-containing sensor histidine kinase [Acidimicrobiales bacterium]
RNVRAANVLLEQLQNYVAELSGYTSLGRDLQARHDGLVNQLELAYETIGLGLTAESLAHEIKNIADRLALRTSQLASRLKRAGTPDRRTTEFVEHVQSSVAALRRQMSHLDPSLRYVRERREQFALSSVLGSIADFHRSRWRSRGLPIGIDLEIDDDFTINMNRGKFQQIIDNLIFNAEYWLQEDLRRDRLSNGTLQLVVSAPMLELSDNGLGIARSVESSLFEPFVTAKPSGEGRGLGLFIVRRLLESEGCDILLLKARNASGRRYRFRLALEGAMVQ